jgi:predicted heme/steroid binding protein
MKKILLFLVFAVLFSFFASSNALAAEGKVFTAIELLEFDGQDGRKSYTSYEGVVYDVTDSKLWKLGEHFGLNAGVDLTDRMAEAPHGGEVFTGFEVVGFLEGFKVESEEAVMEEERAVVPEKKDSTSVAWYEKRIKIGGFSILGWTGILLGVFFVFTFGSCFALPWAKIPLPWTGSKIGPDPLDASGKHLTWSSVHKHFVWITVVIGIIHGIIGFLQMAGIYL